LALRSTWCVLLLAPNQIRIELSIRFDWISLVCSLLPALLSRHPKSCSGNPLTRKPVQTKCNQRMRTALAGLLSISRNDLSLPFHSSDVYAFGVCLWEIVVREDPFLQFKCVLISFLLPTWDLAGLMPSCLSPCRHYDEFVHGVAERGIRPEIPKDCPPKLKKVMQACWHHDPQKRRSFGEVAEVSRRMDGRMEVHGVQELNHSRDCPLQKMLGVIIQCAIEDKQGRKFWSNHFISQYEVAWHVEMETAETCSHEDVCLLTHLLSAHPLSVLCSLGSPL